MFVFADATALDLSTLTDLVTTLGVTGVLLGGLWLFLSDRLYTPKRVDEYRQRTEAAEKQRDEAIEIARAQVQATKELAAVNAAVLDLFRREATGRSRAR